MESKLVIYNTLTRQKERFEPLHAPNVGMYVCGPTVYGDPHLGHARPAITFDLLFRYLKHLGYKVRYVRNITDVGHLEHDADEGEDKIAKKARLEQLEPMEIAQYYTNRYHQYMDALNVLRPSIEPHATGHIIEQQQLVQQIIDNGFAYESNGSIYFDIEAYNKKYHYGILSGSITVSPTSQMVLSISTSRHITRSTITASSLVVRWRTSRTRAANWLVLAKSAIKPTSPCGRRHSLNISCAGPHPGVTVSLAGIASALPWVVSIWARSSTSTEAAWTSSSHTMSVR